MLVFYSESWKLGQYLQPDCSLCGPKDPSSWLPGQAGSRGVFSCLLRGGCKNEECYPHIRRKVKMHHAFYFLSVLGDWFVQRTLYTPARPRSAANQSLFVKTRVHCYSGSAVIDSCCSSLPLELFPCGCNT